MEQGQRIRRHRVAAGMTIQDLARAVGTTPGAVSHWENGRFLPRRERQLAIARAIGVPWVDVFGLNEELAVGPARLASSGDGLQASGYNDAITEAGGSPIES